MDKFTKQFRYPERIRERLLAGSGLKFGDGSEVSAEEIWRFLTEEGPRRFPALFADDLLFGGPSPDIDFLTGIKRRYWFLTNMDRFKARVGRGRRVAVAQVGTPREIYHAARCMVTMPRMPVEWELRKEEGLSLWEQEKRTTFISNECKKSMPAECCTIVAPLAVAQSTKTPIDFMSLVTMTWCSDAVYTMEAAKRQGQDIPWHMVDFPIQSQAGKWRAEYLARQLRKLADRLGALTGHAVTDESLALEIHTRNRMRQLARQGLEAWWAAPQPPTNAGDRMIFMVGGDVEDYPAIEQLLSEGLSEVKQRSASNVLGAGLHPDPVRLFVCGSCAHINSYVVERCGGVVVAHEAQLSSHHMHVNEEGDPFLNLAEAICALPYEQPPEERAAWTAQMIKESRADGAIFVYNWGCNYQSSISRIVTDIVKAKTGLPTLILDISQSGRLAAAEQMRTRIEAFMEILKQNRRARRAPVHPEANNTANLPTGSPALQSISN